MGSPKIKSEIKVEITVRREEPKPKAKSNSGIEMRASSGEVQSRRNEGSIRQNYWQNRLSQIVEGNGFTLYQANFDGGKNKGAAKSFMTKEVYQQKVKADPSLQIPEATGDSHQDAQIVADWLADAPPTMRGEMLNRVLHDGLQTGDSGEDGFAFLSNLSNLPDERQRNAVNDAFNKAYQQSPSDFNNRPQNLATQFGEESLTNSKLIGLTYAIGESGNQGLIADYSKGLLQSSQQNDLPFLGSMAAGTLLSLSDANLKSFANNNPNLMSVLVETSINQSNETGVNSGALVAEMLNRLTSYSQTPGAGEKQLFLALFNSKSLTDRHYGEMRDAIKNFVNKFPVAAIDALNGSSNGFISPEAMNRLARIGAIPSPDPLEVDEMAAWLKNQPAAMKAEYMNWMLSSERGREFLKGYLNNLDPSQQQVFADALNAAYQKDPSGTSAKINQVVGLVGYGNSTTRPDGFAEIVALTKNEDLIKGYVEECLNQPAGSQFGQQSLNNAGTALTGLNSSQLQAFLENHETGQNSANPFDYKIQNLVSQLSSPGYEGDALGKLLNTISGSKTEFDYYDTGRSRPIFRVSEQGLNFFELAVKFGGQNEYNQASINGIVDFFVNNNYTIANWAGTNTDNQKTLTTFFEKYVLSHDPKDANDPITRKIFGTYQGEANGVPVYQGGALNSLFNNIRTRLARTSDPAAISQYGYEMGVVLGAMVKAGENVQGDRDNARQLAADRWGAVAAFLSSPISLGTNAVGFSVSDLVGQIAKETYLSLNDPSSIEDFGKTFKQEFFNRLQEKLNNSRGREEEFRALETFFDALDRGYNAVND